MKRRRCRLMQARPQPRLQELLLGRREGEAELALDELVEEQVLLRRHRGRCHASMRTRSGLEERQRALGDDPHRIGGELRQGGQVLGAHEAAEHVGAGQPDVPVGVADGAPEQGVVLLDGAQRQRAVADARLAAALEDGARGWPAAPPGRRSGRGSRGSAAPGSVSGALRALEQPEQHRHAVAVAQLAQRADEVGVGALAELRAQRRHQLAQRELGRRPRRRGRRRARAPRRATPPRAAGAPAPPASPTCPSTRSRAVVRLHGDDAAATTSRRREPEVRGEHQPAPRRRRPGARRARRAARVRGYPISGASAPR